MHGRVAQWGGHRPEMALTRTTEQREDIVVPMSTREAFAAAKEALSRVGKVQSTQERFGRIVGKVRSGHLNMNRADVTIRVEAVTESESRLSFHVTAQEGAISQNTAARAITRILESL